MTKELIVVFHQETDRHTDHRHDGHRSPGAFANELSGVMTDARDRIGDGRLNFVKFLDGLFTHIGYDGGNSIFGFHIGILMFKVWAGSMPTIAILPNSLAVWNT